MLEEVGGRDAPAAEEHAAENQAAVEQEAPPQEAHGEACWHAVRANWRRDHKGRTVTRDPKAVQEVQDTVISHGFPQFQPAVPMAYVVEVLDLMWEFGYDGHNLEEIARDIAEEQALGFFDEPWEKSNRADIA